ncbi:hypothetical protein ACWKWC_20440 [Geodermatophilus nigrescens]
MRRIVGMLAGCVLLTGACGQSGQTAPALQDAPPATSAPLEMPAGLLEPRARANAVLPPEFESAAAVGLRTVSAGVGTDGAARDSWELYGDRLATLWRDDAGAEHLTAVTLDGEPVWHTELPGLLDPAEERPVQPVLQRLRTADGDWLVISNPGTQQPGAPPATRVLTVAAGTGAPGADLTLPSDRIAVGVSGGHLTATVYDDTYQNYSTLLIDPETGQQRRFDNREVRTEQFRFLDSVIGFYEAEPIHQRSCLQILAAGVECPRTLLWDGQEYEADTGFLPMPQALLDTDAGQRLLAQRPDGSAIDLPCRIGTTRGVPESPDGRYVVVGNNLIDLQTGSTTCGPDTLWWTAIDDDGQGWGRLEGTTTLRVTYDAGTGSVTTTEVPSTQTPLAITRDHRALFGVTVQGTDAVLIAPQ